MRRGMVHDVTGRRRRRWPAAVVAIVAVGAAAGLGHLVESSAPRHSPPSRVVRRFSSSTPHSFVSTTARHQRRGAPPGAHTVGPSTAPLPAGAAQVAGAYATATFTWIAGETPDAWLATLAPLTSPAWWDRLERADPTTPAAPVSVSVRGVYAAHAPAGEVAADVVVELAPSGPATVLVDLRPVGVAWVVVGSS